MHQFKKRFGQNFLKNKEHEKDTSDVDGNTIEYSIVCSNN